MKNMLKHSIFLASILIFGSNSLFSAYVPGHEDPAERVEKRIDFWETVISAFKKAGINDEKMHRAETNLRRAQTAKEGLDTGITGLFGRAGTGVRRGRRAVDSAKRHDTKRVSRKRGRHPARPKAADDLRTTARRRAKVSDSTRKKTAKSRAATRKRAGRKPTVKRAARKRPAETKKTAKARSED